jgi:hypothetical protein
MLHSLLIFSKHEKGISERKILAHDISVIATEWSKLSSNIQKNIAIETIER